MWGSGGGWRPNLLVLVLGLLWSLRSTSAIKSGSKSNTNPEFMVAWLDTNGEYFCAGSLISDQHVLTAAHCFMNISGSPQMLHRGARAGIGIENLEQSFIKYAIADVHIHPSFTAANWKYRKADVVDLAVVKLTRHVELLSYDDEAPAEIVLANKYNGRGKSWDIGDQATVQGWGVTSKPTDPYDLDFATDLTLLKQSINDPDRCEIQPEYLLHGEFNDFNRVKYLCVGVASSKSACYGDGGAPFFVEYPTRSKKWVQIGVFSGLAPGGECGSTKVDEDWFAYIRDNHQRYVNVEYYGPWIQSKTHTILPEQYYPPPPTVPTPSSSAPSEPSRVCQKTDSCGGPGINYNCWCDYVCEAAGDCCEDFVRLCEKRVKPDPLEGSCEGHGQCGYKNENCWCSKDCLTMGDCCEDYQFYCGLAEGGGDQSCVGRCGLKAIGCYCDASCIGNNDCCTDYAVCTVDRDGDGGSCHGKCGQRSGACWCDAGCVQQGDCCPNYENECGDVASCEGRCGRKASNCWCDLLCESRGDCCGDFDHHCEHEHLAADDWLHEKQSSNAYSKRSQL